MSKLKAVEPQAQKTETPRVKVSLPVALSLFWKHGSEIDMMKLAHTAKEEEGRGEGVFKKAIGAIAENAVEGGIWGGGLLSMGIALLMFYNSMMANAAGEGALMMASGVGAASLLTIGTGLGLVLISGYYITTGSGRRASKGEK